MKKKAFIQSKVRKVTQPCHLERSRKIQSHRIVIPVHTGIQRQIHFLYTLDPRLRGDCTSQLYR